MGVLFYVWIIVMILAVIVEISTTELTSFWFAIGAFGALIVNLFTHDDLIALQIAVFAFISIISIILLRPLLKKKLNSPTIATNVDSLIGKTVLVTATITPSQIGSVKIDGVEWSAKANESIEVGDFVEVISISGNTLSVAKIKMEGEKE
ncbi:MAG: NfeD family protein [Candidatus Caccosoma sp.]|mgnify:CR=1 FL=1|nr:NfeD family protein [Candidatus Caccosoma sp.]